MTQYRTFNVGRPRARWPDLLVAMLVSFIVLTFAPTTLVALAEAPPLAVALGDAPVYAAPDLGSEQVGVVPAGAVVVLTGEVAPGFIGVVTDELGGWMPADRLSVSGRPGIETAVASTDTALREAPFPDAGVIQSVPEGEAVMLTGATVGVYDAASRNGAGGWIDRHDIVRGIGR